jgi:hypothetical protein
MDRTMAEITPTADHSHSTRPGGLVLFGAAAMVLVGAFNLIDGLVALTKPESFSDELVIGSLTAWGWAFLVFGAAQILVGVLVWAGSEIALWPGVVLVAGNAIAQLAWMASYPVWSVTIMVLDGLVVYAFVVRGMAIGTVEQTSDN